MIFVLGFFMLQKSVSTTAQVSPADSIDLTGWAWNEKVGWISLNCNNDFDGDGDLDNQCASGNYGLEVVNIDLNGVTTPYIQGCAWAGNPLTNSKQCSDTGLPCVNDAACSPSGTCEAVTLGWLCFSDPGGTNAPVNGVPIIQSDFSTQFWQCQPEMGYCNNDINQSCNIFGACGANNWCVQPLFQGVCYNYDDAYASLYPPSIAGLSKEQLVNNYDPTGPQPEGWRYCYVDSNCANVADGEECVYPQVNGRGDCAVELGGVVSYSGQNCTFDDDCIDFSIPGIEFCEIQPATDFINQSDCTALPHTCDNGYYCAAQAPVDYIAYPYALDYINLNNSASFLKIDNAWPGENLVSFPIDIKLQNNVLPLNDFYDPDNPDADVSWSAANPINGCFNCYVEETKRCTPNLNAVCNDNSDCLGVCNTITNKCNNNPNKSCTVATQDVDCQEQCVVTQTKNKCDNCLEYFYYKDETVKRCNNDDQFSACDTDSDCYTDDTCDGSTGYCFYQPNIACSVDRDCQGFCVEYQTNWRCSDYNYFYCRDGNAEDCVTPDICNLPTCRSDASNICSYDGVAGGCVNGDRCSVDRKCDGNYLLPHCSTDLDCLNTCSSETNKCTMSGNDCVDNADCQNVCLVGTTDKCSITNNDCTSDADCASADLSCPGVPGYCYNNTSCNDDADCASDYYCPTPHCSNNPAQVCATNYDCLASSSDYGTCQEKTVGALEKVLAGYNCSDCNIQNLENSCTLNAYNKNINNCGTCEYFFKTPGVILDNHHNRLNAASGETANLCGWGWSFSDDQQLGGLGWINFSPAITTSSNPYFSVEQGNIYGQKNILSRYNPPFRKYNASYLIESGGSINNLVSSSTISEIFQGELAYRPNLDFLRDSANSGKYKNVLGTLDYMGLITPAQANGDPINKWGGEIVDVANGADLVSKVNNDAMANKVFYVKAASLPGGTLDIDSEIIFKIGQNKDSGAGIIIIEGNLAINKNITYQSSGGAAPVIRYLKNIPSAVWIVKGDVALDPSVTDLAGTFVVLGDGNSCSLPQAGCGQFKTGSVMSSADLQLKVSGSVLAKRFYLDRLFVDTNPNSPTYREPAEKFSNDGRLQANPPLGLSDFSKAIPRFSN